MNDDREEDTSLEKESTETTGVDGEQSDENETNLKEDSLSIGEFISRVSDLDSELYNKPVRESIRETREKIGAARDGDENAINDVQNIPERLRVALKQNQVGKRDLVDSMLITTISSVVLFSLVLISAVSLPETVRRVVSSPTEFGDLLGVTTVLFLISVTSLISGRFISSSNSNSYIVKVSRYCLAVLQIVPFIILTIIFASIFGGKSQYERILSLWREIKIPTLRILPEEIIELMVAYNSVGPTGFTVQYGLIILGILGAVTAYPVVYRLVKRVLATSAVDPITFWEEVDTDTDWEVKDRSIMADMSDETEQEENQEGETVRQLGVDDKKSVDDEIRELLTLPDEMRESPYEEYREVERYWVNAPYVYVSIVYDDATSDYRYVVVEPPMDDVEQRIRNEITERIMPELLYEDVDADDYMEEKSKKISRLERKSMQISTEYNFNPSDMTFHKVLYYIERDFVGYENIDPIMKDNNIEDITCNGDGRYIFVFHRDYSDLETNIKFEESELNSFVRTLARRAGEQISTANPNVGVSLPDGSRAELSLGTEVTPEGSSFTIRLFQDIPFTPIDLIEYGTFNIDQMAYLWFAIEHNQSLILAGGTASGKTTSMNAISLFIPPKQKVVSIEDTKEISLPRENWLSTTTRDGLGAGDAGAEIDMYDLLRSALRLRPEYMIVGEIRGEEAETLFQAMSTGHTTYSTMHANSAERAIGRLTNPPIDVPQHMVRSLDILCIQQQVRFTDENNETRNARRNKEIREIQDVAETGDSSVSSFETSVPYEWDSDRDTFIESLESSHVLEQIAEMNGYTEQDVANHLSERKRVLQYLIDNEITDFELVSQTIQAYMIDSEKVMNQIESGSLKPQELRDVTSVTWKTPADEDDTEMLLSRMPDSESQELIKDSGSIISSEIPELDSDTQAKARTSPEGSESDEVDDYGDTVHLHETGEDVDELADDKGAGTGGDSQ